MIEIILSEKEWINFTSEAKKLMRIKGISNRDLAKLIGKSESSVNRFFTENESRYIAAEIAQALDIKSNSWKQ